MGCYTTGGVHIPGCIGCAVYGHHRCTCTRKSRDEEVANLTDKVQALTARVAFLEGLVNGDVTTIRRDTGWGWPRP